jgi:UDP-glucose:(heptosyl)LPS alpha-1,3-glucosyltransferase
MEDLSRRLSMLGHEVHIFSHRWPLPKDLPAVTVHPVPIIPGQGLLELMTFNRNVRQALAGESFDVIQSSEKTFFQDIYHGDDGCHREWLARRCHYESFMNRAVIKLNPFHWVTLALEKRLFEKSPTKYFIAISQRGREEIIDHYPRAKDRIRVIYNGLELKKPLSPIEEGLRKNKKDKRVLFVGSGYFRKGLFFLIKALRPLQRIKPVHLTIVGGDSQKKVKRLIEKEKVADLVTLIGPVTDVAPYYLRADVLVLPSIYEPFGNVCLEALAYGLPVVTSRSAGASEAVIPNKNGLVVEDPADHQALAEAVAQALALDREEILKIHESVLTKFSWEQHLKDLTGLYQEVLRERKGGEHVLLSH